jgi:polysaccharide export outer membrane protein
LVAPADALSIMIWGHPELNNPTNSSANFEQLGFIVNSKGNIFYPYVGTVHVAGCTVDEIQEIITDYLKEIIVDPMVNVSVLQYRSQFVNVIGEVNLPSRVSITDIPITPLDAVSAAGGATFMGDLQHVVVKRHEELCVFNLLPKEFKGDCKNPFLMHGDVVYVPNKINNQVYVLGEVLLPQAIVMDSDVMTLSEALARSSGVDPFSSNPELLFVFRADNEGNKIAYHLNASSPAAFLLANDFPLQRQDIVYVGTYEPAFLNRIMTNFLSTTKAVADISWSASNINEVINKYHKKSNNNSSAFFNDSSNN